MLSVVFATRNRATMLPRVLDAFCGLAAPQGGWSLVVVDNGSTDDTQAVLARYAQRLPLRVLVQPRPGKNHALNTSIPALEGDLAVFTDDDVLPAPGWLEQMRAAADAHPEADLFGGTVLPDWPGPLPEWLTEEALSFSVLFAVLSRPEGPCDYHSIFGPNMAVRSVLFAMGHRFSGDVGPNAARRMYVMGSETEFLRRMESGGCRGWFAEAARVHHIIRPEQLTEAWIMDRCTRYGLSLATGLPPGRDMLATFGPRGVLRFAAYRAASVALAHAANSPRRMRVLARDRQLRGMLAGWREAAALAQAGAADRT
jgi:glucosyl-dolichyl phosphate glucuronosyltransferase